MLPPYSGPEKLEKKLYALKKYVAACIIKENAFAFP
jgi:hypothetical protein